MDIRTSKDQVWKLFSFFPTNLKFVPVFSMLENDQILFHTFTDAAGALTTT